MPTTAKLSCNHTVEIPRSELPGTMLGDQVPCPKCKRKANGAQPSRSIKSFNRPDFTAEVVAANAGELAEQDQEPLDRDEHGVYTDRNARRLAAQGEAAAVKEWRRSGRGADSRPATPNLDAIEAQAKDRKPNGTPVVRKGRKAGVAEKPARHDGTLAAEARRVMKQLDGKRGKGTKKTPEALVEYIRTMREQHPAEGRSAVMEYAYWVHKLAFSRATWNAAWDQASESA